MNFRQTNYMCGFSKLQLDILGSKTRFQHFLLSKYLADYGVIYMSKILLVVCFD